VRDDICVSALSTDCWDAVTSDKYASPSLSEKHLTGLPMTRFCNYTQQLQYQAHDDHGAANAVSSTITLCLQHLQPVPVGQLITSREENKETSL